MGQTMLTAAGAGTNVISGTDWGFTGADVWTQGMLIVASVASFLILGITVKFAPKIFTVIRSAISGGGGSSKS